MRDSRVIVDEFVIECQQSWPEAQVGPITQAIAREFARELDGLQTRRLGEIRRGAAPPGVLHVKRVVARFADLGVSPAIVGRTLREALERAWRRE